MKRRVNGMMENLAIGICLVIFTLVGCSKSPTPNKKGVIDFKRFSLDTLEGVLTHSGVEIDKGISSDGNGSLKITATKPTVVRLFELKDLEIENARLIYQAKLRTEKVTGKIYLEMWCHFPGKGGFFSRGLQSPLTGTTNWVTEEIHFLIRKGDKPDHLKLNLVIDGKGKIWIDDIRLIKGPL